MGIISRIKGIFRRGEEPIEPLPPIETKELSSEAITTENVKAKMDAIALQIDTLNIRIKEIERMTKEIYDIAKRSQ